MRRLEGLPPNHVPIFPRTRSVCVKMPRMKKKTSFNRCQFPIVPKFSCTSHKSQGQTLPKAIVDLTPTGRHVGVEFAYVPLSRVRTMSDLMLLRPIDRSILRIRVNEACALMMEEFKDRDICKDM
jgi:ATP-dependent exoDNAse (exonuclease V) alpha subunit